MNFVLHDIDHTLNVAAHVAAAAALIIVQRRRRWRRRQRQRRLATQLRRRVSVKDIYYQREPIYFKRAYRMKYNSFEKLLQKLQNSKFFIAHDSIIPPSVRLACALRFFAGGSPHDIKTIYHMNHKEFMNSVWLVVDAINMHPDLQIAFPTDHADQRVIAAGFQSISDANFDCCVGALDGILVWTHRPSEIEASEKARCSSGSFYCHRKHKFGLNCQAVCDARGRFLDVSIVFPGSTSDYLAFEGMSLSRKLESGLLAPGLCLFGDTAYVNSSFMATPFRGVTAGTRDAYNYYHSQVRIRIECAFGMLTHRWAILRCPMPMHIPLKHTIAMVLALARLQNFCIDEGDVEIPACLAVDEMRIVLQANIPLETTRYATDPVPRQLLDGGNHFNGMSRATRRAYLRQYEGGQQEQLLPRDRLHNRIVALDLRRPLPTRGPT